MDELIKREHSNTKGRDVELYRKGSCFWIILKKIPGERMSADVRKFYKSEKQAHKYFNAYVNNRYF